MIYFLLFLEFLVSLIGPFFLSFQKKEKLHLWIAFAAGTVVTVSLIHMLPEAVRVSEFAPIAFLIGFCLVYVAEHFFTSHLCHEDKHQHLTLASWFGLSLHTLFDGVAIASGYLLDPKIGILVAFAILLHQIPVSLSLWGLIQHAHFSPLRAKLLLLSFASMIPIGGILVLLFGLISFDESTLALLFAFSGGTLLFIGASDLLPYVHSQSIQHKKIVGVFCSAVAIITLISFLSHEYIHAHEKDSESHEDHEDHE